LSAVSICLMLLSGCSSSPSDQGPADNTYQYELIAPRRTVTGRSLPVVILAVDVNPRTTPTVSLVISSSYPNQAQAGVKVKRGCGSVTLRPDVEGNMQVSLINQAGGVLAESVVGVIVDTAVRELSGALSGEDLSWDSSAVIRISGDVSIGAGDMLEIGAGTTVELGDRVNIDCRGNMMCSGTVDAPVLFTAVDPGRPWGGVWHPSGDHLYSYVFFTGGGGDSTEALGHSGSQPVVGGCNSRIELDHVFMLDNPGKAFYFDSNEFSLTNSLVSRCDTGGELKFSLVTVDNCYFLDMPNDDGLEVDDDNDAIYVALPWRGGDDFSVIRNSVFISGKDDGIDHNGANLRILNCIIEDFDNEGIAGSNENHLEVFNTLVLNCEQGIEDGYGTAEVTVDHCLVSGNETGFRFGDWYSHRSSDGYLIIHNSISVFNSLHNVWNWDMHLDAPRPERISIDYSIVNDPQYNDGAGCLTGEPVFNEDYTLTEESIGYQAAEDGRSIGLLEWGEEE